VVVDVDDPFHAVVEFESEAIGTLDGSRVAGRPYRPQLNSRSTARA
jgi:hypothetical protein